MSLVSPLPVATATIGPIIKGEEGIAMTVKESLLQAVEELPEEYLKDLAEYARRLRLKAAHGEVPTALASQEVLAKDWLRPEEDEAWQDL